jgi:hypothetical protein
MVNAPDTMARELNKPSSKADSVTNAKIIDVIRPMTEIIATTDMDCLV